MESAAIRKKYLEFFRERGHAIVPGSSLVPFDDPTLLFTSAGMVQFKKNWSGTAAIPSARVTTCQKCMRVGGKDSDLEKVGISPKHHTFFEMLGNFSFGDYFKEDSIDWAFSFVTGVLKISGDRLWVSYYQDDPETRDIWTRYLPSDRLVPLGRKDNFWGPAGETGACGPCTEMYYDFGPEQSCGRSDCKPGCECERFMEFWNLVFPQFDRQADGSLPPLNRRGVDTGMGLERISRILQNVPSNYDTDVFMPVIRRIEEMSSVSYRNNTEKQASFRVIADHVRAAAFLLDDNVLPSNDGRGYVVRRIIRRASLFGLNLGFSAPFLHDLVAVPIATMGDVYPSLMVNAPVIANILKSEEERFHTLRETAGQEVMVALKRFEKIPVCRETLTSGVIPGAMAFSLYGSSGLPRDLITDIAMQKEMTVDWAGFERELLAEKEKARRASEFTVQREAVFSPRDAAQTVFLGYETLACGATVTGLFLEKDKGVVHLMLDRTPFYPEKGGQVGDRGKITADGFLLRVADTREDEKGIIAHIGTFERGGLPDISPGMKVFPAVDKEFRRSVSANHTATHLLHAALCSLVGGEVRQAGSYVGPDRLRFDFLCFSDLSHETVREVERFVQERIIEDIPIRVEEMPLEKAIERNAVALFIDRYGGNVRVVDAGPCRAEVCGGTHVGGTGAISLFLITGSSSIGKNLRRIEAVTYRGAFDHVLALRTEREELARRLDVAPEKIGDRIARLTDELSDRERSLRKYEEMIGGRREDDFLRKAVSFERDGKRGRYAAGMIGVEKQTAAGVIADGIIAKIETGIIVIGFPAAGKLGVIVKVSPDLADAFPAGKLLKEAAPVMNGRGGGSNLFAQGSGAETGCFAAVAAFIARQLGIETYETI